MRCMNCGADIPPAYIHAISKNECPGCSGPIMNEASKELLNELADALTRMPNDPQGVAGWLLSNYRFQKVGSGEPVEKFHRKGSGGPSSVEGSVQSDFVKRSEAGSLVAKSEQLAKIKHSGNTKLAEMASMIQNVSDPYSDDPADEPTDIDEQKAYMDLKRSGFDPFAETPVGGITDVSQAIPPQIVAQFLTTGKDAPSELEKAYIQSEEGRKLLIRDNNKRIKAQEAISGAGGAFRR